MLLISFTFIIVPFINTVRAADSQTENCGRISLRYIQTGSTVAAELKLSPNVNLHWYRWVHFFSPTKPDFRFLYAVKENSLKYDYKTFDVRIKDLQMSDEGTYNIECTLANEYHTFSVNKIEIKKPYILETSLNPSTVNLTETIESTRATTRLTTWAREVTMSAIEVTSSNTRDTGKYATKEDPSSTNDQRDLIQTSKNIESTTGDTQDTANLNKLFDIRSRIPEIHINTEGISGTAAKDKVETQTWLDERTIIIISVIGGIGGSVLVITLVAIAFRRQSRASNKTQTDDAQQKKNSYITAVLDRNEDTFYSEINQFEDKGVAKDMKFSTFTSSEQYEVPNMNGACRLEAMAMAEKEENEYCTIKDEFVSTKGIGSATGIYINDFVNKDTFTSMGGHRNDYEILKKQPEAEDGKFALEGVYECIKN